MKDPGQQAIVFCEDKQAQMLDDYKYYDQQLQYYMAVSELDCTEAVDQTDENVVAEKLATIGNRARWIGINGDLETKIDFHDEVIKLMSGLILKYAEAKASIDLEKRWGEGRR